MKCKCVYIDRGKALIKNGKYENTIGEMNNGLFKKKIPFYIPESFRNITVENKGIFTQSVCPLYIIDSKSSMILNYIQNPKDGEFPLFDKEGSPILDKQGNQIITNIGIDLKSEFDPSIAFKLKVLIKTAFWEMFAKHLKESLMYTLIIALAGYGGLRFLEYLIGVLFT